MKKSLLCVVLYILNLTAGAHDTTKIIGLMPVRNENAVIEQSLRALSYYVDEIIVLDDASIDDTVEKIKKLSLQLPIVEIIQSTESYWEKSTESKKRQCMLDAGRCHGGTHFVLLDADEIFSAHCLINNRLKNQIRLLQPGQKIVFPMIHVWRSIWEYRDDDSRWSPSKCLIACIFADDGIADYSDNFKTSYSGFIHLPRIPANLKSSFPDIRVNNVNFCVIHFRFANWENIMIKRAWYMCLEHIRAKEHLSIKQPRRTAKDINLFYTEIEPFDQENMILKPVNPNWYNYPQFNPEIFLQPVIWRKNQIRAWFDEYERDFFKDLDIWSIDWDH